MVKNTWLGLPAVRQLLLGKGMEEREELELLARIEKGAKMFDHSGKGELAEKEIYNVVKIQNRVDCSLAEVTKVCVDLPRTRRGKIKIVDFMKLPIVSDGAFDIIDRNGDGFITKAELKLAFKHKTMREISTTIENLDMDSDQKLNLREFKRSDHKSFHVNISDK